MKNLLRIAPLVILITLFLPGCYYDKESELYPSSDNCDTTGTMSYSGSIAPIMQKYCNDCHNSAMAESGVVTENYQGLSVVANNGSLWAAVSWSGPIHMPQGQRQLSECNLVKINKWILAGAPNN
jgi:hypothetical protein